MPAETTIQTQSEADAKMVDLPAEGNSVDVELSDKKETTIDTSPKEEIKEKEEVVVEETASSDEMEDYGKKVQSRIDKLTKRLRESERREQAAIEFAQGVQGEANQLKQRSMNLDRGYIAEYEQRVKAETEDTKAKLKKAMDEGDADAVIAAQQDLARLAVESERAKATVAQRERMAKAAQSPAAQQYQQQQIAQQQQQQQPAPPPDPQAEEWADKNEWFGKDEPMTLTAFSVHKNLVDEGVDPSSKTYYNELDKRMRDNFPHKFQSSTPTQTVASVNRGGPVTARKGTVRLTPSQVAIAKKLGVPLSEYAKYVKE
jgi:DNA-binding phage protein